MIHESWRVALDTLRANPLRTLLSTLGIVIGVGSLVAILSLSDGLGEFSRQEIARTTDLHIIHVAPVTTERVGDVTLRIEDYHVFTPADERALAARLGAAAQVGLSLSYASFWMPADDGTREQGVVVATTPAALELREVDLVAGRSLTVEDLDAGARVVVVSEGMAARLTRDAARARDTAGVRDAPVGEDARHALGRELRIGDASYTVVGVARGDGEAGGAGDRVGRMAIPIRPVAELPGILDARAPGLTVRAAEVTRVLALRDEIEAWIEERWGPLEGRFVVASNVQRVAQAERALLIFKLVMGAITGISLLVGGIGIMNVLLASIAERTREIGIRRAVGASRGDIRQQFLAESVTISALGSGLGLLLGVLGSAIMMEVIGRLAEAPIRAVFVWESMLLAVAAALVVGLAFGIYPAVRAGRISPIEALRHE